jgi:hypothetical protein
MNDNVEVILLARCDRPLPNVVRLIRRMSHVNTLSFWAKKLSQSLPTMSVQMGMMVSMLRCGFVCGRIGVDKCVRSTRHFRAQILHIINKKVRNGSSCGKICRRLQDISGRPASTAIRLTPARLP